MTNLMNELPVAVHLASGGDARVRKGGQVIMLEGVSSGSFQVTGGTRYRLAYTIFTAGGLLLLVGYETPLAIENASWRALDREEIHDDVPEGTTVYWKTVSPDNFATYPGGEFDSIHISIYG
jgi:hypothetical protein